MDHGYDLNIVNSQGESAIDEAIENHNYVLEEYL